MRTERWVHAPSSVDILLFEEFRFDRRIGVLLRRDERGVVVTILCDSGDKYLSERFWDE